MQVTGRAVFGRQHADLKATRLLSVPHKLPPLLEGLQAVAVFGCAGVRHLGAFLVAHASMKVDAALGAAGDDVDLAAEHALGNAGPVAEVAHQLEVGEAIQHAVGDPGVVEDATPMCFMPDGNAELLLDLQDLFKEPRAFVLAPSVAATVTTDESRRQCAPGFHLLPERGDVLLDAVADGQHLQDVREPVVGE